MLSRFALALGALILSAAATNSAFAQETPAPFTCVINRENALIVQGVEFLQVACEGANDATFTRSQLNTLSIRPYVEGSTSELGPREEIRDVRGLPDPSPGPYPNFVFYAQLRADERYKVSMDGAASVNLGEDNFEQDARRFSYADLRVLDGDDDGLGLGFEAEWIAPRQLNLLGHDDWDISLHAEGELSSDKEVEAFSRSFTVSGEMTRFVENAIFDIGRIKITPITVVSDQDTRVINGRTTLGFRGRIRGSQRWAEALSRAGGCGAGAGIDACQTAGVFVSFDAGASYNLRAPDDYDADESATYGGSVWWTIPLSPRWDLELNAGYRDDGDNGGDHSNYSIAAHYFLDGCERRAALTISYIDGDFAPLGEQVEGLRMGLRTLLGQRSAAQGGTRSDCPG